MIAAILIILALVVFTACAVTLNLNRPGRGGFPASRRKP